MKMELQRIKVRRPIIRNILSDCRAHALNTEKKHKAGNPVKKKWD